LNETLGSSNGCAVVIVAFNRESSLANCLRRLLAAPFGRASRIVVVAHASPDGAAALIERTFPPVRVIESKDNLGYVGGANLGILQTTEEVIVLLRPDVAILDSALNALADALVADERAGVAGSELQDPDQAIISHADGPAPGEQPSTRDHEIVRPVVDEGSTAREVGGITGSPYAIKRLVLKQVGLFDEGFYPECFETADLCQRIREAGFKVLYVPSADASVAESRTPRKTAVEHDHFYQRNRIRYALKHFSDAPLWQHFLGGEAKQLHDLRDSTQVAVLRQAYQDNLDFVNGVASFLANPPYAAPFPIDGNRAHLLWILRSLADRQLQDAQLTGGVKLAMEPDRHELIGRLRQKQVIVESPFVSSTPIIGRLVVRLRIIWNWMSTTWYVRPLTRQQNDFNAEVVETVDVVSKDLAWLDAASRLRLESIIATEQLLTRVQRDVARLEARLGHLEACTSSNETLHDPPSLPDRRLG
jgi:GT2 family glycosyltransferase